MSGTKHTSTIGKKFKMMTLSFRKKCKKNKTELKRNYLVKRKGI